VFSSFFFFFFCLQYLDNCLFLWLLTIYIIKRSFHILLPISVKFSFSFLPSNTRSFLLVFFSNIFLGSTAFLVHFFLSCISITLLINQTHTSMKLTRSFRFFVYGLVFTFVCINIILCLFIIFVVLIEN